MDRSTCLQLAALVTCSGKQFLNPIAVEVRFAGIDRSVGLRRWVRPTMRFDRSRLVDRL
jgi:hypothetical protein